MTEESTVSLDSLIIPEKEVVLAFDEEEMPGFEVTLCGVSRDKLASLRKKCVTTKMDRKTRMPTEEFNDDLFLELYCGMVIKGWSGLKYSYLEELLMVDTSGQDPEDCLGFSQANAKTLMKGSDQFDSWVITETGNLENFSKSK